MKGKRLVDVLDDKGVNPKHREFWDRVFGKLKKLGSAIEMFKGPSMNIDDTDYRWVNDRIEYFDNNKRLLTKEEMNKANELWKKYKK